MSWGAAVHAMADRDLAQTSVFTVPGLHGSGPSHWQTLWENEHGYSRIEQDDWDRPIFTQWEKCLARTVFRSAGGGKSMLVAHSLGCHLIVKSLPLIAEFLKGVFFVAPPDLAAAALGMDLSDFAAAAPEQRVPGWVVYSEDDPFAPVAFSEKFARDLGFRGISVGRLGHINAESGLGGWNEGHRLFTRFLQSLRQPEPRTMEIPQ